MKYNIGDYVVDEDGNTGVVVIKYNDGDLCQYENDAAHPNPKPVKIKWESLNKRLDKLTNMAYIRYYEAWI